MSRYLLSLSLPLLMSVLMLCGASGALAVVDVYTFEDESQRQRYLEFIEEMRCPKCQNQNLAGSDSPIAADLRRELRRMLEEGKSDREIVDFMVARYGDYVLYQPQVKSNTALLWGAPVFLLLVAGLVLAVIVRRRARVAVAEAAAGTDSERLSGLLRRAAERDKNA